MADVILLQEWLDKAPRRPVEPREAQILLFTGIRYERLTEESYRPQLGPTIGSQSRSSGAKRKKN